MPPQIVDLEFIPAFFVAALCGAALGLERELQHKPAGLRTNMLIAIGAAMFTYASIVIGGDRGRIAAQIVTGIGFLGAGTIMRDRNEAIHGLTSAATVWVVAALGILAGAHHYLLAVVGALLALGILHVMGYLENLIVSRRLRQHFKITAENREWIFQHIHELFLLDRIEVSGTKIRPEPPDQIMIEMTFYGSIRRTENLRKKILNIDGVKQVSAQMV